MKVKVGQKYGRLLIVDFYMMKVVPGTRNREMFECLCDCGRTVTYTPKQIREGIQGCRDIECDRKIRLQNLKVGGRVGTLTLKIFYKRYLINGEKEFVSCKCDCGNTKEALVDNLKEGITLSCGCQPYPSLKNKFRNLYNHWRSRYNRCYDELNDMFDRYNELGISMCDEWMMNYNAFIEWALEQGWEKGYSVAPKNFGDDYSPQTCHLITSEEALRLAKVRRADNKFITLDGETKTLHAWSKDPRCQVGEATLYERYKKEGSSPDIVTRPPKDIRKHLTAFDETKSVSEWAKDERCPISNNLIRRRVAAGWPAEIAISSPKGFIYRPKSPEHNWRRLIFNKKKG